MRKSIILIAILSTLWTTGNAQKNVKTFIFGHSLIHHENQVNPTPSQETSVPHWIHFLAQEAGYDYAVSGQYGLLPQHDNLPPIAQWGFDFVTPAWDSDNESFGDANFNSILITPGNFMQWQAPDLNYPNETVSPISSTNTIFDWCNQQEDTLKFYIYENWPDMASFLNNGFPPTPTEWSNYNDYLNTGFHDWFLEYHDALRNDFPQCCINMIPVGPVISTLLQQSPYDQIPIDSLYEDDAPHGRPTIYFLAALTTYMAMYEEKAPASYIVDPIIHPIIREHYIEIVDIIWMELNQFHAYNGSSNVFCSMPIFGATDGAYQSMDISISPNPVVDQMSINGNIENHIVDIFDIKGNKCLSTIEISLEHNKIDLSRLKKGLYFVLGRDRFNHILYRKKIIKI